MSSNRIKQQSHSAMILLFIRTTIMAVLLKHLNVIIMPSWVFLDFALVIRLH
ncbi:hypothetical protein SAMN02745132_04752 [Enterovibrio nigricans DSM 22720]|uniref:Transmembrane protein n=1 Tax=Enterovibrio nigricans DSM 22720 TaxID=1121868 RepID=A0A1T4W5S0_9GAMM|nr:hypothetical protein SAMN02745132_04752 [Enterovibrio nigricans DSM 22720]